MSVWHGTAFQSLLSSPQGDLVSARIAVDPRSLEDLLECLSNLPFPINPEIFHGVPTVVAFPAWGNHIRQTRDALRAFGFDPDSLEVKDMLGTLTV